MTLDATFWVTISFFIFLGILIYFKIPYKVKNTLEQNISNIKDGSFKYRINATMKKNNIREECIQFFNYLAR